MNTPPKRQKKTASQACIRHPRIFTLDPRFTPDNGPLHLGRLPQDWERLLSDNKSAGGGDLAVKGIFITTSHFTKEAVDYAAGLRNSKIVLIDGVELAELMIDHGIGVATAAVYEVKRVDSDYFDEEE